MNESDHVSQHTCSFSLHGANPHLETWVRQRVHPFDPSTDDYHRPPFSAQIQTTKQSAIYALHGYHLGKKPHDAIRAYVAHFTAPGDVVLDPFAGSGSTALAALQEHRHAIGIDASPAATFIARAYLFPIDINDLLARCEAMVQRAADELQWLYATRCHRCGGKAMLHHLVYSQTYACPRCKEITSLFEALQQEGPSCCPSCLRQGKRVRIHSSLDRLGLVPVGVSFSCLEGCHPKRSTRGIVGTREEREAFDRIDLAGIACLERLPIPHPIPDVPMMNRIDDGPWGDEWRPSRNFRCIRDLFTHRNLWALAALWEAADGDLDLQAVLTSAMLAVSRKAQHLEGGGGYIPGHWALPPMTKQRNVLETVRRVFGRSLVARQQLQRLGLRGDVCLSTQSCTDLSAIPDASIDYIFTDPPYGGMVQYGELNFLWEAWLGLPTDWHRHEIIVNRTRGLSLETWTERMSRALAECHRVLKPNRWMSVCYHDGSKGSWSALQQAIENAGFDAQSVGSATSIDTKSRTYNQYTVDKVNKRDLVLNLCKSPRARVFPAATVVGQDAFDERVREIIIAFLKKHPGSSKDRIFDEVVSTLLCTGPMQDHDFERILRQVAEPQGECERVVETGVRRGAHATSWALRP
ncbi:MAG TPA: DNA methyltransferase [Polyangiaceae bacterium]|jgi:16S rRNA G966 N2-methylase RsmD|nr:MAG: Modification methylase HindIII [Deltaproteobacteria bacterium ADurb.Bin207]HNS95578.1 DNA methyltransferase [Polyangiaceae bacterium]HNZ21349.1 DNA methyltransferase [Polyangiaceae bacterium]HOD24792.1 DNA methyltransferase [Polyangiaceae bacterium]HOE47475.1 DNA methyltransferase [Polyangiaceae bacterium]